MATRLTNKLRAFAVGALLGLGGLAFAATFNLFSPANGILKGNSSTYVTTAAVSADVRALWTGTCNSGTYLRGDGSCQPVGGGSVTSVDLTMPTGFSVAGNPITGSGTFAVTTTLNGPLRGNGSGFTTGNIALGSEVSGTLPVAQGGTGAGTLTGLLLGNGTSPFSAAASSDVIGLWTGSCNSGTFLRGDGQCQSAGGGGTPGGSDTQMQYNNAGVFGGTSNFTFDNADLSFAIAGTGGGANPALTITAPASNAALSVVGDAGAYAMTVAAPNSAGSSNGLLLSAGTNGSDNAFRFQTATGGALLVMKGSGAITSTPSSGTGLTITSASGSSTPLEVDSNGTNDVSVFANSITAGNAFFRSLAATNWSFGTRRSDSAYVLANASSLGSNVRVTVTTGGVLNATGGVQVNGTDVCQSNGTNCPSTIAQSTGTFTASISSLGAGTFTVYYVKTGSQACLHFPSYVNQTPSATTFNITGFPTSAPDLTASNVNAPNIAIWVQDNNTNEMGAGRWTGSGTLQIADGPAGEAFQNTGNTGFFPFVICYRTLTSS